MKFSRNPHDSQTGAYAATEGGVLYMRKHIVPVRDLITNLMRNEIEYFEADNKYYLRDLHDHMVRNVEELDFLREQLILAPWTYTTRCNRIK